MNMYDSKTAYPEGCMMIKDKPEMTFCRSCEAEVEMMRPIDQHWWARRDNYGIFKGIYCDD